jgi:ribonucleoside-diphosphate reductase beta chain
LGEYSNILRLDHNPFKVFDSLIGLSETSFWFFRELQFITDKVGWNNLTDAQQYMFKTNIAYQTAMDSAVANSIPKIMGSVVSQPTLDFLYNYIGLQENNHAMSYVYGLDNMFGSTEASNIVDGVYTDEFIKTRLTAEVDGYDDLHKAKLSGNTDEIKRCILRCLWHQMIVENIKFPPSFFNTFAINADSKFSIPNVNKLIQLIAFDEHNIHIPTTRNIMSIINKDPEGQGFTKAMLIRPNFFLLN